MEKEEVEIGESRKIELSGIAEFVRIEAESKARQSHAGREADVETQEGEEGTVGRDTQNSSSSRSGEVQVRLGEGGDVEMQEDMEVMEGRDTQNSSSRGSGEVRVGGRDVETQGEMWRRKREMWGSRKVRKEGTHKTVCQEGQGKYE